jgi:hypothetical protein
MTAFQQLQAREQKLPPQLREKWSTRSRLFNDACALDEKGGDAEAFYARWDKELSKLERGATAMRRK